MKYLVIEHLSGSKANQVEEFPVTLYPELLIGRDLAANIRFTDVEALVGRQHVKITQAGKDSMEFRVTDLNSRNGTFLNGVRIAGTSNLRSGDVIQLGPEGPQLRFVLRPSTERLARDAAENEAHASPTPFEQRQPNSPLAHLQEPVPAPRPKLEQVRAPAPDLPVDRPAPPPQPAPAPVVRPRIGLILGVVAFAGVVILAAGYVGYRTFLATATDIVAVPDPSPGASPSPDISSATPDSSPAASPSTDMSNAVAQPGVAPDASPSPTVVPTATPPVARPKPKPAPIRRTPTPTVAKSKSTSPPANDKKKSGSTTESGKKKKKKNKQA